MHWPPNKAWTSCNLRNGFRHFVAINYGGKGPDRWVGLVSVLDGNSRFRVLWDELKDSKMWTSGWLKLSREEANPNRDRNIANKSITNDISNTCLHPSDDSGLLIPNCSDEIRPWGGGLH